MTETCSAVLRSRRNCSSDGAERTDDGRAFDARAAVTGKARSPSVVHRVVGIGNISNYGESVALSGSSSNVKVAGHRLQSQDEKYAVPFVLPHGGWRRDVVV